MCHEKRLVAWRHQHDVRQAAQVGDVERPVMRRAVVADQPPAGGPRRSAVGRRGGARGASRSIAKTTLRGVTGSMSAPRVPRFPIASADGRVVLAASAPVSAIRGQVVRVLRTGSQSRGPSR